jgi:hypothetical protein
MTAALSNGQVWWLWEGGGILALLILAAVGAAITRRIRTHLDHWHSAVDLDGRHRRWANTMRDSRP